MITVSSAVEPLQLASRSPRRRALLTELGVAFELLDIEVDESPLSGEAAVDYVQRVANLKAAAGQATARPGSVVLAADTTVSRDGRIFGKPRNRDDAFAMLHDLAGHWHEVHSAVVVVDRSARSHSRLVTTRVEFQVFDEATIAAYIASGEPFGKAGAYAIQGLGGALVRRIEGSYSAVVGLPLAETTALLDIAAVPHALNPGLPTA